jgi:hypothetical protein
MQIITRGIAALATFAALLVLAPAALADTGDGGNTDPGNPGGPLESVIPLPGPLVPGPILLPPPGGWAHGCNGNRIAMNPESPCARHGIGCGPC